ncbi:Rhodanese-like domain-containing protein 11 [Citrus sinensis]|uniref:Rhodanese-like domain-containing protein 11 n=1 Tax=Citrus sinensis TaxID=2711 RepID=A0ACB8LT89_CITSI|nr:Rhodanese-like domain-containing protein 11 [Citrus sinensis]
MESLALPCLNSFTSSRASFHKEQSNKLLAKARYLNSSKPASLRLTPYYIAPSFNLGGIRMQAGGEEYELKQMRDMAAAKKRWDALIRDGKVKVLTPREAGYAVQLSSKTLLDVRPSTERKKAWIKGSIWIPIFDIDDTFDAGSLPQKVTNFVMGGWWSGVPTLSYNKQFLSKVEEKLPKDTDLIVACQKGLRNLFWVQGGLEAAEEEDLVREGPQPLKFAGIGGLSEFLGYTSQLCYPFLHISYPIGPVNKELKLPEKGGVIDYYTLRVCYLSESNIHLFRKQVGVFLAADALIIGAQQVGRYIQDIRSH